jgi:oligosaccharide repeat unit polymerase
VFFILISLIYILGIVTVVFRGGLRKNLPYAFVLAIYTMYLFITPTYFCLAGKRYIMSMIIPEYYYYKTIFIFSIGVLCFIIGYNLIATSKQINRAPKPIYDVKIKIIALFGLFYSIIFANMLSAGVNIFAILTGKSSQDTLLGFDGSTNYLQSFSDTLIPLLIAAYYLDVRRFILLFMIFLSFLLFFLLGFRYRIILTLIGFGFAFLYKNKINTKTAITALLGIVLSFYIIIFSTFNRFQLTYGKFGDTEPNPLKFDYSIIFDQTRGALPCMIVLKHYDQFPNTPHEYGETMFFYPFLTGIPRIILPNKSDYYPAPEAFIILSTFYSVESKYAGEALLNVGNLFIAFGLWGVWLGNLIFGLALRLYQNSIKYNDFFSLLFCFVICLVLFQWVTRGYIPQEIMHLVYMWIGVASLRVLAQRQIQFKELRRFNFSKWL